MKVLYFILATFLAFSSYCQDWKKDTINYRDKKIVLDVLQPFNMYVNCLNGALYIDYEFSDNQLFSIYIEEDVLDRLRFQKGFDTTSTSKRTWSGNMINSERVWKAKKASKDLVYCYSNVKHENVDDFQRIYNSFNSDFVSYIDPYNYKINIKEDSLGHLNLDTTYSIAYGPRFYGYGITSVEGFFVEKDLFRDLFSSPSVPIVDVEGQGFLIGMNLAVDKMFYGVSYSFSMIDKVKNDSLGLESKLRQNSLSARVGYNLINSENIILSSYIGFRSFRFKHLTRPIKKNIDINDYLEDPIIDLRVTEFKSIAGLNISFFYPPFSYSLYGEYLLKMHNDPIVRTKGRWVDADLTSPVGNWLIGFGAGVYF